ncbi:metalloendopeptidase-like membrane protein [Desulfocurvibacter africanus PCS]|uniref:Metalloendopeptidase-like membrane protein n=1 Tax=Desulfocurvibacter africanus PCS TaxID=1262666 RepID=M5Q1R8_DESAF|nr:peptidoglycan DD-metalloendopeptidase family protein [Desulfocurvibacter africanus]EMG36788.1 metalloendopeptidase-like membrane protein [Desulfocurvibacter africanus PCS]
MTNYYRMTIKKRSKRKTIVLVMICFMGILSLMPMLDRDDRREGASGPRAASEPGAAKDEFTEATEQAGNEILAGDSGVDALLFKEGVVQKGDTVMTLLGDFFSPAEIISLARECEEIFSLSRICAGHAFAITTQGDDFHGFEYEISAAEKLRILKAEEGFQVERAPIEYDVRTERVSGVITSNLYAAVDAAGESPELAVRLAEIFAWDIDFIRDIREGDTFTVLAEKRSRDGQPAGYGRILAAMFINQGQVYKGFLFETAEGQAHFYDENGRSMRKAFLKTPLDFARITSGFSRKRFHPVLGVNRPHLGTDYAAPTGTPIKSVGDGVITVLTRNNASGNYITIRHNNSYETSYLHMSRFASGLKRGSRVRQGQVIGYVGQTGWATGPHVCFRMKKNGQHINPVKLKTPPAEGVPQDRREAFTGLVSHLTTTLEQDTSQTAEAAQRQAVPAL